MSRRSREPFDEAAVRTGFIVGAAPGINPGRWVTAWNESFPGQRVSVLPVEEPRQRDVLIDGTVLMCFVRGFDPGTEELFHLVPLFEEKQVVAVSRDHVLSDWEEVEVDDLRDESLLQPPGSILGWTGTSATALSGRALDLSVPDRLKLVADGTGVLVLPMSVARLHARRDVVSLHVLDLPTIPVGLAWLRQADSDLTQEFVGVVRGRTANTSRGGPARRRRGG